MSVDNVKFRSHSSLAMQLDGLVMSFNLKVSVFISLLISRSRSYYYYYYNIFNTCKLSGEEHLAIQMFEHGVHDSLSVVL